jgi:VIT1/CCC1 family predicted Fe2+/Mn2+ transporter
MSQTRTVPAGHAEPHGGGMATRLNWLRAAVLGTNDGIVSTAGLVVGVAGATSSRTAILTADTVTSIAAQTVVDAAGQPAGVGIVRVAPGGAAAKAGCRRACRAMALSPWC